MQSTVSAISALTGAVILATAATDAVYVTGSPRSLVSIARDGRKTA